MLSAGVGVNWMCGIYWKKNLNKYFSFNKTEKVNTKFFNSFPGENS